MTCTTLIVKTSWKDGQEAIDTIDTAEEMAGIFLPHERDALHRGEVVERAGAVTTRYLDATAIPHRLRGDAAVDGYARLWYPLPRGLSFAANQRVREAWWAVLGSNQ